MALTVLMKDSPDGGLKYESLDALGGLLGVKVDAVISNPPPGMKKILNIYFNPNNGSIEVVVV